MLETLDGDCVSPGDHQSFARVPRIESGLDLANHFLRRDQRLVVEMPASLGKCLIFELNRVRPRALEQADRAADVQRVAVAGISIDDERGADTIADHGGGVDDFAHGDETDIGASETGIGNGRPRHIERRKPRPLGEMRGERIENSRRHHDRLARQSRTKVYRIRHGHSPR